MEHESMPMTSAVLRVMRVRVVSRSSAALMAWLMSRSAAISASLRSRRSRAEGRALIRLLEDDQLEARAWGDPFALEESLIHLERIAVSCARLVRRPGSAEWIVGHLH